MSHGEHDLSEPAGMGERRMDDELIIARPPGPRREVVATLGPTGTSSEAAGRHLLARMGLEAAANALTLHPPYEEASTAVLAGQAGHLLVANAYQKINRFYMDRRITLERVFVLDTPHYGLAARGDRPLPLACDVVTHPAPHDLIRQLIPSGYRISDIGYVSSTSAAAATVAKGEAHLALTTAPAARLHRLRFVSDTRPIKMLWSVFGRHWDRGQPPGPTALR